MSNKLKVLVVCGSGRIRSLTAASILSLPPFNLNTCAAGIDQVNSIIPINKILIDWCDEIICTDPMHFKYLENLLQVMGINKLIRYIECKSFSMYNEETLVDKLTIELRKIYEN
jgi:predicted protein tyrosine phosphatase